MLTNKHTDPMTMTFNPLYLTLPPSYFPEILPCVNMLLMFCWLYKGEITMFVSPCRALKT